MTAEPGKVIEPRPLDGEVVEGLTLDERARVADREHGLTVDAMASAVEHAIRAGAALASAKAEVGYGGWMQWVADNCSIPLQVVQGYIRIFEFKEMVQGADTISEALALLRGVGPAESDIRFREPALRAQAREMFHGGMPKTDIADALGVHFVTIYRWVNPDFDKRQRENNARNARRERDARRALREQERERAIQRAVRKEGTAMQHLYATAERMQDDLAQAHREKDDREARAALSLAGEHYRKMRDEIVRALGVQ